MNSGTYTFAPFANASAAVEDSRNAARADAYSAAYGHAVDSEARKHEAIKKALNEIALEIPAEDSELFDLVARAIGKAQEKYCDELDRLNERT